MDKFVGERRSKPTRFGGLITTDQARLPLRTELALPGMTIGLFGGTFDPPHKGHLHVAQAAKKRLGLNAVWWLVAPQNPHKANQAGIYKSRLKAVSDLAASPGMVSSNIEARLQVNRTISLITNLRQRYPYTHFVWIMGADNLRTFHKWARWRDVFKAIPIVILSRPQDPLKARLSPAARQMSKHRINPHRAHTLSTTNTPAWTYIPARHHTLSSTSLRTK
jgi:nicotinate-nucleotide adenylyltransferase